MTTLNPLAEYPKKGYAGRAAHRTLSPGPINTPGAAWRRSPSRLRAWPRSVTQWGSAATKAHWPGQARGYPGKSSNQAESEGMNHRQKQVLVAGIITAALIGLFPPWLHYTEFPGGHTDAEPAGHRPLFSPPRAREGYLAIGVDYGRLFVYWTVVGLLTGAAALALRGKPEASSPGRKRTSPERKSLGSAHAPTGHSEENRALSSNRAQMQEELVLAYGRGQLSFQELWKAYKQGLLSEVDLEEAFALRGSNPDLPPGL